MKLRAQASQTLPGSRHEVFDFATNNATYERTLNRSLGPIAGLERAEMHMGHRLQAGALRSIVMKDGTTIEETILVHDPPRRHQYRWTEGARPPASWMLKSATGTWDFSGTDGRTRVDWTYEFELKSPIFYPLAAIMRVLFQRWMALGLDAMRATLER
jgi:hypothetical protein